MAQQRGSHRYGRWLSLIFSIIDGSFFVPRTCLGLNDHFNIFITLHQHGLGKDSKDMGGYVFV